MLKVEESKEVKKVGKIVAAIIVVGKFERGASAVEK